MIRSGNIVNRSNAVTQAKVLVGQKKSKSFKGSKKYIANLPQRLRLFFWFSVILLLLCFYVNLFAHQIDVQIDDSGMKIFKTFKKDRHYMDQSKFSMIYNYRSNFTRSIASDHITIATHMSASNSSASNSARFQRLLDLNSRWDGYISVAVYTKQNATVTNFIDPFIKSHASSFDGKVSFHLIVDKRSDKDKKYYPINVMRNIAMEQTETELVLNLDVDFIPSLHSHDRLKMHISHLKDKIWSIMVLPAFERKLSGNENWATITSSNLPATKKELLKRIGAGDDERFIPFHSKFFPAGHGPTEYARWYKASDPYHVGYQKDYEPYYVVRKSAELPPFWEHFTGFGKNKLSWVEEMYIAGYELFIVPDAFIIHINHSKKEIHRRLRKEMNIEYKHRFWPYLTRTYAKVSAKNKAIFKV